VELAVRGGGHSLAGHSVSEGGIVLDLSAMKNVDIDVEGRTAWADGGLTAGEYTEAAGEYGLATGFGDTASVGIGGLTLGGGIGFLVRKYGLTIDDLLAAEIVTADGELLRVDAKSHPDLFWAIRGGGGNFGVVTRFQYRLHEVDSIVGGMLILPASAESIASFIAAADAAPEELSTIANIMIAPPMPFLPAESHGKPIIMAMLVYAGDAEAGLQAIAPFRKIATPLADMLRPMSYPEMYKLFPEEGPGPVQEVARTFFLDSLDRNTAQVIIDHLQASTAAMKVAQLRVLGGAMARVPVEATAFAHRGRKIMAAIAAVYEQEGETPVHEAWVDGFAAALRQGDSGAYVNFQSAGGEAHVREAYPGNTWERLAAVKAQYDPTNLFRLNHNIVPASASN
jgi:FAD/FMN-containing dehydrogenase